MELYNGENWDPCIKAQTLVIRAKEGPISGPWYTGRCNWCGFGCHDGDIEKVKQMLIDHLAPGVGFNGGYVCHDG